MARTLFYCFMFLSLNCFAQQNLPMKINGGIPDINSAKLFLIQVGAFKVDMNAEKAYFRLQKNALNPFIDISNDYSRVVIRNIPANQIINVLAIIKEAGFDEVIIREDTQIIKTEDVKIITPRNDDYLPKELKGSEIEVLINELSDEEFLTLLSLMEEFPGKNLIELIKSIKQSPGGN